MFLRAYNFCFLRMFVFFVAGFSAVALVGCSFVSAELSNRGGYLDKKGDEIWFIADTKPMRVLRAYVLLGSITRLAQTTSKTERKIVVSHVNASVRAAAEAFYCAYSQPGSCVYFDERMVEFEVSVLKLMVAVLSKKEDEELFSAVYKSISDVIPPLKAVDTLSSLIDGLASTGELAVNTSKAIASILKAGQLFYVQGRRIGALYRDAVELQMVTSLSSLDTICAIKNGQFRRKGAPYFDGKERFESGVNNKDIQWAIDHFYGAPDELPHTCESFRRGQRLWQRGAGNFSSWVTFLDAEVAEYRAFILPNKNSFIQASDLLWRSCEHLTSDIEELSDCVGRRPVASGEVQQSCIDDPNKIKGQEPAVKEEDTEGQKGKENKTEVKRSGGGIREWNRRCAMILISDTWYLRANQRAPGGSVTRLEWLSNLTPAPSNPLIKHPSGAF